MQFLQKKTVTLPPSRTLREGDGHLPRYFFPNFAFKISSSVSWPISAYLRRVQAG
jgi:hypothetical protein